VLRALDYFRRAGVPPDDRMTEAIGLVMDPRLPDGRWPLHEPHPDPVHAPMETGVEHVFLRTRDRPFDYHGDVRRIGVARLSTRDAA
jgi:hypothetical protein